MTTRSVRSARNRLWHLREAAAVPTIPGVHPLVAQLLAQRGVASAAAVRAFLTPDYKAGLHDPFLLKGMDVAAQRVAAAINALEPIAVYGDFDADGVTAVALLMQAITAMGGNIRAYIPHRLREGYGLNLEAVQELAEQGVRLLITVDCGITNVQEVARANELGLDVVVTDHHTPPEILPAALAIVNPKQPGDTYPCKQLVGVGIAYKLVQALVRLKLKMPLRGRELLDVVALGTVTDMGPLVDENRLLVKAGLEALNESQRPGVQALIRASGLAQGKLTTEEISFVLGPRLNAAGRIDDAVLAYQLLLADDLDAAQLLAIELGTRNRQRQEQTKTTQAAALAAIAARGLTDDRIIVLDDPGFPAGVVGLVAAKLVEELGRPVLLIERSDSVSRGSARSVPGFNIFDALNSCRELFVRFGGHAAAAGFSIENDKLPALRDRLLAYADEHLPDELLTPALELDAEVPINTLSWELLAQLDALEPFGVGNPRPVLLSQRVLAADPRAIGADKSHLKLRVSDGSGGPQFEAIGFRLGHLAQHLPRHPWVDIAYTLGVNEWNGNRTLQLTLKDLRRA